jgi:hypothetical protein
MKDSCVFGGGGGREGGEGEVFSVSGVVCLLCCGEGSWELAIMNSMNLGK